MTGDLPRGGPIGAIPGATGKRELPTVAESEALIAIDAPAARAHIQDRGWHDEGELLGMLGLEVGL